MKRLARPFTILLILGFINILAFGFFMTIMQDRYAIQLSQRMMALTLDNRLERLSDTTLDHAFWDETYNNIVSEFDQDWVIFNLGDFLHQTLDVSDLLILDGDSAAVLNTSKEVQGPSVGSLRTASQELVASARAIPNAEEIRAISAYIDVDGDVHFASASLIIGYTTEVDIFSDHVMVLTARLKGPWLSEIATAFDLSNLRVQDTPGGWMSAGLPLSGVSGETLAYLVWTPPLPGLRALPWLTAVLVGVFGVMVLIARRFLAEVRSTANELERLSVTDRLTGLGNRHKMDEALELERLRLARSPPGFSVLMIDIDHFKSVNDVHGHLAGDAVLQDMAKVLSSNVRRTDVVGRWGGEEFLVLCPGTHAAGAMVLAESLRATIESHDFPGVGRKTCSIGVATARPDETIDTLLDRADAALYRAKDGGRNRVAQETSVDAQVPTDRAPGPLVSPSAALTRGDAGAAVS